MVLGVADGGDPLQVAPDPRGKLAQKPQAVINNVRAPVERLPPTAGDQRLPVVAPAVPAAAQLHLENLAQHARGDDLQDVLVLRLESPIVTDVQAARAAGGGAKQLAGSGQRGGDGLFQEHALAPRQGRPGLRHVVQRRRGDVDQFDRRIGDQILDPAIARRPGRPGQFVAPLGDHVAGGDERELPRAGEYLHAMHAPPCPAEAHDPDAYGRRFRHEESPFACQATRPDAGQ